MASFVRVRENSTDLVTAVVFIDDTGHGNADRVTKDNTPLVTGITIPNKKVLIEAKLSTGSWTTPTDIKASSGNIVSSAVDGSIQYQMPVLDDGSYDVRAFVIDERH